jgi:hypothetical protein
VNKVTVIIKHTQTATFDIGDLPVNAFRTIMLEQGDGTIDGNYGLGEIPGSDVWVIDSIEVEEAGKVSK